MSETNRIRLNLAVSPEVKSRIEHLQRTTEGSSITEVIRRALAVYEEFVEIGTQGGQLVVEMPDGARERLRII